MGVIEYVWDWIIPFLVVLTILVFVHELGHYWVARRCGVRVEVFSIGFGKELWGWNDRHGTRWKFSAVPLGGYVKMFGEFDYVDEADRPALTDAERAVSFHHKSLRQRSAIVAAGPIANFIFAVILLFGLFAVAGAPAPLAAIGQVEPDSAAATAGLQKGDVIVRIDDEPVEWFEDVRQIVSRNPGVALRFDVRRGDADVQLSATPRRQRTEQGGGETETGLLGIRPDATQVGYEPMNPLTAIGAAFERTYALTAQILASLWQIITGSRTAEELGGPLKIAQLSGQMAQDGPINLIFFMAALSINLGLINLLPIPMLDGGHLTFYLAEALRGKPLDKRIQEYGFRFGLIFVLAIMLFATWNDLMNLKVIDFFKQIIG